MALAASYFLCNAIAEERRLTDTEVQECTMLYIELKLSFTDVPSLPDFISLSESERARVNTSGYHGYLSWKQNNPHLVQALRAQASTRAMRQRF